MLRGGGGGRAGAQGIAHRISTLVDGGPPDIVVLTEVFDEDSRDAMVAIFDHEGGFPCAVSRAGRDKFKGLGEDSGLFVLSRFSIIDAKFAVFDAAVGADQIANKGMLRVTVHLPPRPGEVAPPARICIAATHLQAFAPGRDVRSEQLAASVASISKGHADTGLGINASILCGDLNFTDVSGAERAGFGTAARPNTDGVDTAEYPEKADLIKGAFPGAVDCYRALHPDIVNEPGCATITAKQPRVAGGRCAALPARVAFAFRLPCGSTAVCPLQVHVRQRREQAPELCGAPGRRPGGEQPARPGAPRLRLDSGQRHDGRRRGGKRARHEPGVQGPQGQQRCRTERRPPPHRLEDRPARRVGVRAAPCAAPVAVWLGSGEGRGQGVRGSSWALAGMVLGRGWHAAHPQLPCPCVRPRHS